LLLTAAAPPLQQPPEIQSTSDKIHQPSKKKGREQFRLFVFCLQIADL
jgi:hypothetical protein